MLETVKKSIKDAMSDDTSFARFYDSYVMKIQDMDIDNEILPLIRKESTECVKLQAKLLRKRKRDVKRLKVDIEH